MRSEHRQRSAPRAEGTAPSSADSRSMGSAVSNSDTIAGMSWGSVELEPEVRDWLEGLAGSEFGHAACYVDLLAERGVLLSEPYTKQLDGKLRSFGSTSVDRQSGSPTGSPPADASSCLRSSRRPRTGIAHRWHGRRRRCSLVCEQSTMWKRRNDGTVIVGRREGRACG